MVVTRTFGASWFSAMYGDPCCNRCLVPQCFCLDDSMTLFSVLMILVRTIELWPETSQLTLESPDLFSAFGQYIWVQPETSLEWTLNHLHNTSVFLQPGDYNSLRTAALVPDNFLLKLITMITLCVSACSSTFFTSNLYKTTEAISHWPIPVHLAQFSLHVPMDHCMDHFTTLLWHVITVITCHEHSWVMSQVNENGTVDGNDPCFGVSGYPCNGALTLSKIHGCPLLGTVASSNLSPGLCIEM